MAENNEPKDDVEPEETPGYKAPAKKSIAELTNMDTGDESLVKYKESLLAGQHWSPADDPRRVIVQEMAFVVAGRKDVIFDLTDTGKLKGMKLTVKEGTQYKIRIGFKVQHEIIPGLKYHHVVKRGGLNADKQTYMVGSYGPKKEMQTWSSPADDAPKGMIYRGKYKIHSKFIDDDKCVHLEWDWEMDIKSDWA